MKFITINNTIPPPRSTAQDVAPPPTKNNIVLAVASRLPKSVAMSAPLTDEQKRRFLSRLHPEEENGCIIWGGRRDKGCGTLKLNGKEIPARRMAWMVAYGEIPPGDQVRSTCKTFLCVNPAHLTLFTPHSRHPTIPGQPGRPSKFTEEDILTIRQRYHERATTGVTMQSLADEYDVCTMTICLIVNHKSHRHIPPAPGLEPKQLP